MGIVNYISALTCKVVILKKVIAKTSIRSGGCYVIIFWNDTMGLKFYLVVTQCTLCIIISLSFIYYVNVSIDMLGHLYLILRLM